MRLVSIGVIGLRAGKVSSLIWFWIVTKLVDTTFPWIVYKDFWQTHNACNVLILYNDSAEKNFYQPFLKDKVSPHFVGSWNRFNYEG